MQNQIKCVQWCMRETQLVILVPYWWPDDTAISGTSLSCMRQYWLGKWQWLLYFWTAACTAVII